MPDIMRTKTIMLILLFALTSLTNVFSQQSNSNSKSTTWKWDTIIAWNGNNVYSERQIQAFDNNNNLLMQLFQHWHWLPNGWIDYNRFIYSYDGSGNLLTKTEQTYTDSVWSNNTRESYSYDGNGNLWAELHESFYNNLWQNNSKYTYAYDVSGNLLTKFIEQWHANYWENYCRYYYTYDSTNNLKSSTEFYWQTNRWKNYYRWAYFYDTTGRFQYKTRDWGQDSIWKNYRKFSYTYNSVCDTLLELCHVWADSVWVLGHTFTNTYDTNRLRLTHIEEYTSWESWAHSYKFIYTYDSDGKMIESLLQEYDTAWLDAARNIFTRDADGNLLTHIYQIWNNNWIYGLKYTYTYDLYGNSITGKFEYADQLGNLRPGVDKIPVYSDNIEIYSLDIFFRYEAHFTSTNSWINNYNADKVPIIIYPNPANDIITISCTSIKNDEAVISLYNIQGKLMLQQRLNQDKTEIDISNLAEGLYIVTVIGHDISISEKIIKE
jgi:hypothetical protein